MESRLGYAFKEKELLKRALTHRSFVSEGKGKKRAHNERLEFLGDSVLSLILSEYLYLGGLSEAEMSRARAAAVRGSELARAAAELGLGGHLLLGKGEETTGGRKKESILAGAFEAVIGAVYLDGGYDEARRFVLWALGEKLDEIAEGRGVADPKTRLQELFQREYGKLPDYRILKEEGMEHEKTFTAAVYLEKKQLGRGRGKTKREAETAAAREALEKLAKKDPSEEKAGPE